MVKRVPILRDALVDEVTTAATHVYSPGMNFGHKSKTGLYVMTSGSAVHLKLAFDVSPGTAYEVIMEEFDSGDKLHIKLRNDLKGKVKEIFGVWDTEAGGATNLYSGGSYASTTNIITLGSELAEEFGYVLYTKENVASQQKLGDIGLTDVNLVDVSANLTNSGGVGVVTAVTTWRTDEWAGSSFVVAEPTDTTSGQWAKIVSNTGTVLTLDRPFKVIGNGKDVSIRSPLHGWGTVPMTTNADVIKAIWATPTANVWYWQDLTALVPTHTGWRLRVEGITDNGDDTLVSADVVVADSVEF